MLFIEQEPHERREVRGQYDKGVAKLYIEAAKFFPHVTVRKIAAEGNVCYVVGGSFKVLKGNVALEISGRSDDDPGSRFKSFYEKVEELKEKEQKSLLSKFKNKFKSNQ